MSQGLGGKRWGRNRSGLLRGQVCQTGWTCLSAGFGVPQQFGAGGWTLPSPSAQLRACCAAAACRRHLGVGTKWLLMQLLWGTLLVLGRDVMTWFISADSAVQMDPRVPSSDCPWVWLIVWVSKMFRPWKSFQEVSIFCARPPSTPAASGGPGIELEALHASEAFLYKSPFMPVTDACQDRHWHCAA